jgi:hypothetical protein
MFIWGAKHMRDVLYVPHSHTLRAFQILYYFSFMHEVMNIKMSDNFIFINSDKYPWADCFEAHQCWYNHNWQPQLIRIQDSSLSYKQAQVLLIRSHCVKAKHLICSCFLDVNQKISVTEVPDYGLGNLDLSLPFGRSKIFSLPFHNVQSGHPALYPWSKADAGRCWPPTFISCRDQECVELYLQFSYVFMCLGFLNGSWALNRSEYD